MYYAAELYPKTYETINPKEIPVPNEKIEKLYKHFATKIPFSNAFKVYVKDKSYFEYNIARRLLPLMS